MKLLDLYRSMLSTAGMTATADGYINRTLAGESEPALLEGKRLVLPTPEHMANPDWSNRVAFHPLQENLLRGESEVVSYFRTQLNVRLNYVLSVLGYQLLQLAASPAEHARLTPDQHEFLSCVVEADETTGETFRKVMEAMGARGEGPQRALASIYLKRAGSIGGRRYQRVGVVSFPFYDELKKPNGAVFGVKMRVKDRETLLALMKYMIPQIDQTETHLKGSDSAVAPSIDALMRALLVVAVPVNDLIELFGKNLAATEELVFDSEWVETLDSLDQLLPEIRRIPMQAGNEGVVPGQEGQAPARAPSQVAPAAQAPSRPTAYSAPYNPPQQPQVAPPQLVHQGTVYVPAQQAYGAPQRPQIQETASGALDFRSIMRANPQLVQQPPGYPGAHMAPQQHLPGPLAPRTPDYLRPDYVQPGYQLNGRQTWGGGTVGYGAPTGQGFGSI